MHEMTVQQDSQEEIEKAGPSKRGRKKRGRTSESDRKEPKKARQEEVDALLEEQQQTDQPRMETAKTVDVPAAKFAQFQDLLNQAFQSGHVQVSCIKLFQIIHNYPVLF